MENLAYRDEYSLESYLVNFGLDVEKFELFHCERTNCRMLKESCRKRIQQLLDEQYNGLMDDEKFSMDIHCVNCPQGKELTGLIVEKKIFACSVEGCGRPIHANGLCSLHYSRERNNVRTKICSICKEEKVISPKNFHPNNCSVDGYETICIKCQKIKGMGRYTKGRKKGGGLASRVKSTKALMLQKSLTED